MFNTNKRKMFEYVMNDVINQLTETQFTQYSPGPNDYLKTSEFKLKNNSGKENEDGASGMFNIDARIDACVVSRGFMEKNGIEFEVEEKQELPREIATNTSFKSIGTSTLRLELAGSPTSWEIEVKIMPYKKLCAFDDENPAESAKGFFDIGLGQKFLEEVRREEKSFESRREGGGAREWKVTLPEN